MTLRYINTRARVRGNIVDDVEIERVVGALAYAHSCSKETIRARLMSGEKVRSGPYSVQVI